MKFIGWLLSPILVIGLRLPSYTPLELFQRFSLRAVLPCVLHTARICGKGRGELVRLLKHKQIPFDWFYEDSCRSMMGPDRFKDILAFSMASDRTLLLSLKCMESLSFPVSKSELSELGPTHFFDHVNQQASAFYQNDLAFFDLLKPFHHPSGLVQDCSWLTSTRVHNRIFRSQAFELLDHPDAWRIFHHSCFFSGCTGKFDFDRMHELLFWLRDEVSMGQFIFLAPIAQLRWVVHLLIIRKRIEIEFTENSVYLVVPLTEYLSRLENALGFCDPKRDLIRWCCHAWFKNHKNTKVPKLPRIKDILLEIRNTNDGVGENIRWTLAVLELYHLVAREDIWRQNSFDEMLCENLQFASPIEQSNWIRIYLEAPKRLHFIESTLTQIIRRSKDLQNWIMTKSKPADPPELRRLIFGAIPLDTRLKETRARYFKAPNRFAGRLLNLYRTVSARFVTILRFITGSEMEQVILAYLSESGPYITYDADSRQYKLALLSPSRMGAFAFILSTAKIFSIPLEYFKLCKDQERLIFGVDKMTVEQAVSRFDFFEQSRKFHYDILRLSDCTVMQVPEALSRETSSDCKVIYFEDIMVRLSKAASASSEVLGQLIDYNELPS